jgi:hypothetical protein
MVTDEVGRHRLMRSWVEQAAVAHRERENNASKKHEHKDENHEDKASGKPSSDESETNGNTEIGTDHCKH